MFSYVLWGGSCLGLPPRPEPGSRPRQSGPGSPPPLPPAADRGLQRTAEPRAGPGWGRAEAGAGAAAAAGEGRGAGAAGSVCVRLFAAALLCCHQALLFARLKAGAPGFVVLVLFLLFFFSP